MSRIFRLNGTGPHAPAVDAKLAERVDDLGALARRWFDVIRAAGTDVCEVLHDGYPTATLGDAAFAYVATFKAHVNVGFFHGADLPDPAGLLQGTGKFMRHVKVRPGDDLDEDALRALVAAAYDDLRRRLAP